jgi:hypothetical protein
MRRLVDEDAPTTEWRPDRGETPLGGVELAALSSKSATGWDAQTFAVRLPPDRREGPNRLVAMCIAAMLSTVVGIATFLIVMRIQAPPATAQNASPTPAAMMPLVQEGVPIPSPLPSFDPTLAAAMETGFVPTSDVQAPPDPRMPELVQAAPAFPIVPYTSAASAPKAPHAAPAPPARKGKKQR